MVSYKIYFKDDISSFFLLIFPYYQEEHRKTNTTSTEGLGATLKNHFANMTSSLIYILVFCIFLKNYNSCLQNCRHKVCSA